MIQNIAFRQVLIIFAFQHQFIWAQVTKVEYDRVVIGSNIVQTLPYLSKEEKDRITLTWGKDRNEPQPYVLLYDDHQAIYQLDEEKLSTGDNRWRREKYIIHTQYKSKRKLDNIETLGKKFTFDEDLPKIRWKILNDIKEVAGYVCMKAITYDSIKNQRITAWFTSEIPVSLGPEDYHGLPGLILEIQKNENCSVITATKVINKTITEPIAIPKKKGKKITIEKFNKMIAQYIKESIEAQRNPYWSINY